MRKTSPRGVNGRLAPGCLPPRHNQRRRPPHRRTRAAPLRHHGQRRRSDGAQGFPDTACSIDPDVCRGLRAARSPGAQWQVWRLAAVMPWRSRASAPVTRSASQNTAPAAPELLSSRSQYSGSSRCPHADFYSERLLSKRFGVPDRLPVTTPLLALLMIQAWIVAWLALPLVCL